MTLFYMKRNYLIATIATVVLFSIFMSNLFAQKSNTNADAIIGVWLSENGRAKIKIERYGEKYSGKIFWLIEPIDPKTGKPKVDVKNPNEKLRDRPLLGMVNLLGFKYKGKNEWGDGTVYDPGSGKTYDSNITLEDPNTIEVRGYIGISIIGKTIVWTRVVEPTK
jgi:uncharacterized protein (DUF2147 family)